MPQQHLSIRFAKYPFRAGYRPGETPCHWMRSGTGNLVVPSQRVACRDGGTPGACHVQIWHERERDQRKLLGPQVSVFSDGGEEPFAETGHRLGHTAAEKV